MFDIWSVFSSVRKKFTDVFSSRTDTSSSLGIATDGSRWNAINGIIQVISGRARATTTPTELSAGTEYPIATVTMPTANNVIDLKDTLQGSSVALWVQSSSDWWMVDIDSTFNSIPGNLNYGVTGSNYGADGTNYGAIGSNYGITGSNYGATGSNYGVVGSNYGIVGSNYGAVGSNYATVTPNYGLTYIYNSYNSGATGYTIYTNGSTNAYRQAYTATYRSATTTFRSSRGGVYSATNYFMSSGVNYFLGTFNYVSSSTNYSFNFTQYQFGFAYGATGSNYQTVTPNYGSTGSNYGAITSNYGIAGSNYGAVGTNYGSVGSNYGAVGSNYAAVGSNYGATGSNAITYAYTQYLRIKQSSASVVSTIASAIISTAQTINSLRVQVSGNTITAKAYSDNNFVTQIGSDLVHTPTGITITTEFGIGISPSAYEQSDIIGSSVQITRL